MVKYELKKIVSSTGGKIAPALMALLGTWMRLLSGVTSWV